MSPLSRITLAPNACYGKPCIRGLRYPVTTILELPAAGMSQQEILADYPDLEAEHIICLSGLRGQAQQHQEVSEDHFLKWLMSPLRSAKVRVRPRHSQRLKCVAAQTHFRGAKGDISREQRKQPSL